MTFTSRHFERTYPRFLPASWWEEMLRLAGTSAILGLLLWGWFAWTLTPVERHYFGAYALSSVHAATGADPDTVTWILKTGPKKKLAIAQPEDLTSAPATGNYPPFQLSAQGRAEGWTGVDWSVPEAFPAASARAFLRESFFDGQSFWALVFRPVAWPLVAFCLWQMFALWRLKRARDQGAGWDYSYRPTSWREDLSELAEILFEGSKAIATGAVAWGRKRRRAEGEAMAASPLTAAPCPPTLPVPQRVTSQAETVAQTDASPPAPKLQPTVAVAAPKPMPEAPASPFGPGLKDGEPAREWDLSQWID